MKLRDVGSRKLDLYKKVHIVRRDSDFTFQDEYGYNQSVPVHDRIVSTEPVITKQKLNIPIPIISEDPAYENDVKDDYKQPNAFILRPFSMDEFGSEWYDYVLDQEDVQWFIFNTCNFLMIGLIA